MPHMQLLFRAIAARARSWTILPVRSRAGEILFVQIGLKTIHMTHPGGNTMRTDGTTLVGADDMVLDDSGGLLTSKEPMPVK